MFGDYPTAVRHYRRIWQLLESDRERRMKLFGEPTPLFLPLPSDPGYRLRRRGLHRDGIVHLALTVTHRGDVIGSKSLEVAPRSIMEFRVRKAAKRARFRPAFREGQPVKVRGHPLTYNLFVLIHAAWVRTRTSSFDDQDRHPRKIANEAAALVPANGGFVRCDGEVGGRDGTSPSPTGRCSLHVLIPAPDGPVGATLVVARTTLVAAPCRARRCGYGAAFNGMLN